MRPITKKQYDEMHQGGMVPIKCINHPDLEWATKRLATELDSDGVIRPNWSRTVFYSTHGKEECDCAIKCLVVNIVEEEQNAQEQERKS